VFLGDVGRTVKYVGHLSSLLAKEVIINKELIFDLDILIIK
jgi:hypothetical protein